jgi:hypothetical protein
MDKNRLTVLPGLSEQEVWARRAKHFRSLSPEQKFYRYCSMLEIDLMISINKSRPKAKLTLRNKNGHR